MARANRCPSAATLSTCFNSKKLAPYIILGLALLLSACVSMQDLEASQERREDIIAEIEPGVVFEQRLSARYAGTSNIDLWVNALEEQGDLPGSLAVEVYAIDSGDAPLVSWRFDRSSLLESSQVGVPIPEDTRLPPGGYAVRLFSTGGTFQIFGADEDIYSSGGAFLDQKPVRADAAFVISYRYGLDSIVEDLRFAAYNLSSLLTSLAVLLLPGWFLLRFLQLDRKFDMGENIALMAGLGLAIIPLLLSWTSILELRLNANLVRSGLILLALLIAWTYVREYRSHRERAGSNSRLFSLSLVAVLVGCGFLRLVMIRNISAPPWVDSIHHALFTRLIMENGAYPVNYNPYLQIPANAYHTGFHSVLAVFHWASGVDLLKGMLVFGQVLNTITLASVYLFAHALTKDRLAGLTAALIAGTFSPMPAYYTSWGRYTQLAGIAIMVAASGLIIRALEDRLRFRELYTSGRRRFSWGTVIAVSVLSAGLFLTHLRVVSFYALLLAAILLVRALGTLQIHIGLAEKLRVWLHAIYANFRNRRAPAAQIVDHNQAPSPNRPEISISAFVQYRPIQNDSPQSGSTPTPNTFSRSSPARVGWHPRFRSMPSEIAVLLTVALLSSLLVLPVMFPTLQELIVPRLQSWSAGEPAPAFNDFNWAFLTTAWGRQALGLAGLGLLVGVLSAQGYTLILALWVVAMFFLSNLDALGLPGAGFVSDLSVEIILFLPISLLAGVAVSKLSALWLKLLPKPYHRIVYGLLGFTALVLGLFAARSLATILNPVTFLYRTEDRAAITWIEQNIPPGETVAINPFSWGYGLYAGNDGGYWIAPLTGRPTMPPPVIYGLTNSLEYFYYVDTTSRALLENGADPPALHAALKEADIEYIYLGARGGPFDEDALSASPLFEALFKAQGVGVYRAR